MNILYSKFQKVQNSNLYTKSHGLSIFRFLICDKLDEMNMLSKQNLDQLVSNNFLQYLIYEIKQSQQLFFKDVNYFKRFASFLYFQNQRDPFQDNLLEIIDSNRVKNFLEGNISFQFEEILNEQEQNVESDEQQLPKQVIQQQLIDEVDQDKYFEFLNEEKKKLPNPAQEVNQILQKYWNLEVQKNEEPFQQDISSQKKYRYSYKCIGMEIQPIFSPVCNTKQEAKNQAARLLYPHLKYYDTYNEPYKRYSYSEQKQLEKQQSYSNDDEDEENQIKQIEDLFIFHKMYEDGVNSVSEVEEILSKQNNDEGLYNIQEEYSRQSNGLVLYQATFTSSIKAQAYGNDKSMAKSIAYFKLIKDIKKYFYDKNGSYCSEFEQRQKKTYKRRGRNDEDEDS